MFETSTFIIRHFFFKISFSIFGLIEFPKQTTQFSISPHTRHLPFHTPSPINPLSFKFSALSHPILPLSLKSQHTEGLQSSFHQPFLILQKQIKFFVLIFTKFFCFRTSLHLGVAIQHIYVTSYWCRQIVLQFHVKVNRNSFSRSHVRACS